MIIAQRLSHIELSVGVVDGLEHRFVVVIDFVLRVACVFSACHHDIEEVVSCSPIIFSVFSSTCCSGLPRARLAWPWLLSALMHALESCRRVHDVSPSWSAWQRGR